MKDNEEEKFTEITPNQFDFIKISSMILKNSKSLNSIESKALDLAINSMLKTKPTLPGRL